MSVRVKVGFPFTNSAGSSELETMWAVQHGDEYEVDNIPFYAKEIALGDVVSAAPEPDGLLVYSGLIRPSGHSTVRLWFSDAEHVQSVRDELRKLGCASELSDLPRLVAVDIPASVAYEVVKEFLDRKEGTGVFEYQEACLGFL